MKTCTKCGKEFEGNFCTDCGTAAENICPKCNTAFTGKFCSECGYSSQSQPQQQYQPQYQQAPPIIINNVNANTNTNTNTGAYTGVKAKNKWVALILCFFLGFVGGHKFYEEKVLLGIVYMCTFGLFGIGILIDFIVLLFKPNPYFS